MKPGEWVWVNAVNNYTPADLAEDGTYWCAGKLLKVTAKRMLIDNIWTESTGYYDPKNVKPMTQKLQDSCRRKYE